MKGPRGQLQAGAIAGEEQRLDRLKANSYEQRRIEGRPNHTLLSQSAIACLVGSLACQGLSLMGSDWSTNWMGVLGYARKREWGLFGVRGVKFQSYAAQKDTTCMIFGEMHILATCMTPLCQWYQLKCTTYMQMMYSLYALAFVLILVVLVTILCLSYLFALDPRSIKVNVMWSLVAWMFHAGCVIGYPFITDALFDALMNLSYYPQPYFGIAFYVACFANLLLGISVFLGWKLSGYWPEPDEDDDEEEDDDDDAVKKAAKDAAAQQQQMMMQQQQQQMMMQQQQMGGGQMMYVEQQPMMMDGGMGGGMMAPQGVGQMQAGGGSFQPQAGMQPMPSTQQQGMQPGF